MVLSNENLDKLHGEIEALREQNKDLKETLQCLKFCENYSKDKRSFQYAMKFIQIAEPYLYFFRSLLLPLRTKIIQNENFYPSRSAHPIRKVAIIIHAYYLDVLDEINSYIKNIPCQYDIFLNVPEGIELIPENLPFVPKKIYRLPNKGKDVGSFIHILKDLDFNEYDLALKLHTKKSVRLNASEGDIWRKCFLKALLGDKNRIREIFRSFETSNVGIAGVEELYLTYNIREENLKNFKSLLKLIGIKNRDFGYHAGTMFWFSPSAFKKLIANEKINFKLFESSKNQDDGDLEHAFERVFSLCARSEGFLIKNFSLLF